MTNKPRIVFDCNVLLQVAARERSAAATYLNLAEIGQAIRHPLISI